MTITTPRYTTTFGRDDTTAPLSSSVYPILPKPLPRPLDELRLQAERLTGAHFNTCIVNYYADGKDSISYHSDDERFLGDLPTIASISLGSTRDFHMRVYQSLSSSHSRSAHASSFSQVAKPHQASPSPPPCRRRRWARRALVQRPNDRRKSTSWPTETSSLCAAGRRQSGSMPFPNARVRRAGST